MKQRLRVVLFWAWTGLFLTGLIFTGFFLKKHGFEGAFLLVQNFLGENPVFILSALFVFYLLRSVVFMPVSILGALTGVVFPGHKLWAITFACIGTIATAFLSFAIARTLGRTWVAKHETPRLRRFDEKVQARGFFTIFILRILVFVPFDLVNLASGFSAIRFRDFAWATVIGVIPEVALQVFVGSSISALFQKTFFQPANLISFILILAGLFAAGYFLKTHPHFRDLITAPVKKIREKRRAKKTTSLVKARKMLMKFALLLLNTLR